MAVRFLQELGEVLQGDGVQCLVGDSTELMAPGGLPVFHEAILDALAELSRRLLHDPLARNFPDVIAFAFFCRKSHLDHLAKKHADSECRVGRGIVLHIAPNNVPVNFAFSMVFGLLAGNANIVRVGRTGSAQAERICSALSAVLDEPRHQWLRPWIRVVRYQRSDATTQALLHHCQARVVWGGDQTVRHMRQLPVAPRSVEVAFPDRVSCCLIEADAVLRLTPQQVDGLAEQFYNDAYLMKQGACASPHMVFWSGGADAVLAAQTRFWRAVALLVERRGVLQGADVMSKWLAMCAVLTNLETRATVHRQGGAVFRIDLSTLPDEVADLRGTAGLFFEYRLSTLDELASRLSERFQTLTVFGPTPESVVASLIRCGARGIDRVVPVGKALDMGVVWDGVNVVTQLSRIVATQ